MKILDFCKKTHLEDGLSFSVWVKLFHGVLLATLQL